MRVNKAVELLEERQPVYFEFVDGESAGTAASMRQSGGADVRKPR